MVLATARQPLVRQRHVDRRALVRRQHITFQRRLLIALELSIGWIDFKQSVDRLHFQARSIPTIAWLPVRLARTTAPSPALRAGLSVLN